MANNFMFSALEVKILENFGDINSQMVIDPTGVSIMSITKSILANYKFDKPYDFQRFGVYEIKDVLSIIKALDNVEIDVHDKFINFIGGNNDKVKYFTTAESLIEKVPDIESKFKESNVELKLSLPADKLEYIKTMANCLKSNYIFFETDNKKVRITVGDELESTNSNYELSIDDGISVNNLTSAVKVAIADFKIIKGDYEIIIASKPSAKDPNASKKITKWVNLNGATYYIFCGVV